MKIAFIGPFPPFRGGIAQFSMRLFETMKSGFPEHDFVPISFRRLYPSILFPGTSQLEPETSRRPIEALPLIDSTNPFRWISARDYLNKSGFDWIIVQWWHPFFAPSLLASIPGRIPCAAVCHNVIPHESFPFANRLSARFMNRMKRLIVHSGTDLQDASGLDLGASILKLYHPIYDQYNRPEITRETARKHLDYSDSVRLILFFGLVRPYKGVTDLIRAMNSLPEDVLLLIAGECYEDRNEILKVITSLGLSSRIRWVDEFVPDEDVSIYFNASDIVVLPYRKATQSGVAQIALSFDRVLVLTDTGGLSELVDPGSTGYLAEAYSPASLIKSILAAFELASDPEVEGRIKLKAASFSWENYASELMEQLQ
jgi:glycosyltransferase involved in cell wall biosynthesis